MPDLSETIEAVAADPLKAASDGQSAEQHPLPDLIEADRYLAAKAAAAAKGSGLRFTKLVPPGAS